MGATGVFLTLGIAAMVLMLGGLLVYMSQLIRNAYQIKVELHSELEAGLRNLDEEADKKLKWIKRDTFEELEKGKAALTAESNKRLAELQEALNKRLQERDDLWKRERMELLKVIEQQRENIKVLDQRVRALRRDQRRVDLAPLNEAAAEPAPAEQVPRLPPPAEMPMAAEIQAEAVPT